MSDKGHLRREVTFHDRVPEWGSPGTFVKAEAFARGVSQASLALRLGLSQKHLSQLLAGEVPLSMGISLRIERATGISSDLLNRMEANYQGARARRDETNKLAMYEPWLRKFSNRELEKRRLVDKLDPVSVRVGKLLTFFGVADPDAFERTWSAPLASGFRRAQHLSIDSYSTALWLRLGEKQAERLELGNYDPAAFEAALRLLPQLTRSADLAGSLRQAQNLVASTGVAIAFVSEVSGSRACGAATWRTSSTPTITLSGRYKFADSVWFSLLHEAAHLLLHPKRARYIHTDKDKRASDDGGLEEAADRFAARTLVPRPFDRRMTGGMRLPEVEALAGELKIDAGVLAGQLAYRYNEYGRMRPLRRRVEDVGALEAALANGSPHSMS